MGRDRVRGGSDRLSAFKLFGRSGRRPGPKVTDTRPADAVERSRRNRQPDAPRDTRESVSKRFNTTVLDRDTEGTDSDPSASRELTKRQSVTAGKLLGTGDTSLLDDLESDDTGARATTADGGDVPQQGEPLVEDPIQEEQEAFPPGTPGPEIPSFEGMSPTSEISVEGIGSTKTYDKDGVSYTITEEPDGTVTTGYQVDGVYRSSTEKKDGTVENQTSLVENGVSRERTETVLPNGGGTTVVESVERPDGKGSSTLTRVEVPDPNDPTKKLIEETYSYEGEQGSLLRTTSTLGDGSSETRTDKSYTVNEHLETLVEAPPVPDHLENVVPLPSGQRGSTSVHEVEVVTTDADGNEQQEYVESTYSQSSQDIRPEGPPEGGVNGTWPAGIVHNAEDSRITNTVTTIAARDEDGKLVETSSGSQTVELSADRMDGVGGGKPEVKVTRTDGWTSPSTPGGSDGTSTTTFSSEGFSAAELEKLSRVDDQGTSGHFVVNVPDSNGRMDVVSAAGPATEANTAYHSYLEESNATTWFGAEGDEPLDLNVSIQRDADGKITTESVEFAKLDEKGNGKTITRVKDGEAPAAWTNSNISNDGQDYERQTVFDGTDVSVYEKFEVTAPGQFRASSESRDGDHIYATSSSSREEVGEQVLLDYLDSGDLSREQFDSMRASGPPYLLNRSNESVEPKLTEDGKLVRADGEVVRPGYESSYLGISSAQGYSVDELYRKELEPETGRDRDSRLSLVSDPKGEPPITGDLVERERDPKTDNYTTTSQDQLEIRQHGEIWLGGKMAGNFQLSDGDIATSLREGDGYAIPDLIGTLGLAAASIDEVSAGSAPRVWRGVALTGESGVVGKIAGAADTFALGLGLGGMYLGLQDGDARTVIEGAANVAGGLGTVASAIDSLPPSVASKFSSVTSLANGAVAGKVLGAAGGVVGVGFGLYDVFTAETTTDRVAGGLGVASGAVAAGSAFFGPPGWVLGGLLSGGLGLLSIGVAATDDKAPAGFDDRLQT